MIEAMGGLISMAIALVAGGFLTFLVICFLMDVTFGLMDMGSSLIKLIKGK